MPEVTGIPAPWEAFLGSVRFARGGLALSADSTTRRRENSLPSGAKRQLSCAKSHSSDNDGKSYPKTLKVNVFRSLAMRSCFVDDCGRDARSRSITHFGFNDLLQPPAALTAVGGMCRGGKFPAAASPLKTPNGNVRGVVSKALSGWVARQLGWKVPVRLLPKPPDAP